MKKKITLAIVFITIMNPVSAGIPVIDAASIGVMTSNLAETAAVAAEEVAQTAKQIEEYTTQLREYATQLEDLEKQYQMYENMVTNTLAPVANVWDKATSTMNKLRGLTDTINAYKNKAGSIDAYLSKFKDTSTYRNSPCYTSGGCSAAEWSKMKDSREAGSEAQINAVKALFKGLDSEQDAIEADAAQLEKLQSAAQGAEGHLQALGYANQLASHQANQLLHIRNTLASQGNVIASRNAALADKEAQQDALDEKTGWHPIAHVPAKTY